MQTEIAMFSLWRGQMAVRGRLTMRQILADVASERGTTLDAIRGRETVRATTVIRDEFYARANDAGHAYAAIGRLLGRHHTSVMAGARRHRRRQACAG